MPRKIAPWTIAAAGLIGFLLLLRKREELDETVTLPDVEPDDEKETGGIPDVEAVEEVEKAPIIIKGFKKLVTPDIIITEEMKQALTSLTFAEGGPSLGKFWLVEKTLNGSIKLARKILGVGSGSPLTMPYVAAMQASQWNQITYGDKDGTLKPAFFPWNFDPVAAFLSGQRAARALTSSGGPRNITGAHFFGLLWAPQIDNQAAGTLGKIVVTQPEPPAGFFALPEWTPQ